MTECFMEITMAKPTRSEFDNCLFQQEDPGPNKKAQRRRENRLFWFVVIPLGACVGAFAAIVSQNGTLFLPVWGLSALLLWALGGSSEQ